MDKVAQIAGVSPMQVYEVATFYTMYHREKVGKFFIQLCGTTPCMVNGALDIKKTICDYLKIKDGETTKDGMFSLLEVECLGACANAPMVQINDDYYESLTGETMLEILKYCQEKGKLPPLKKWASLPMNGQLSCEGPYGLNHVLTEEPKPYCRELDGKVDPASVKKAMYPVKEK